MNNNFYYYPSADGDGSNYSAPDGGDRDMENRLWNYIDGSGTPVEKSTVEKLLESKLEWREKYEELLEVHQLMQSSVLEAPSMRFTKNVMEEIAKYHIAPATKTYINKKVVWGIGIFFITMFAGLIIYGLGQIDWSAAGSETNLPVDFSKLDFSKLLDNTYVKVFMMVNVILGLVLLDRYFTNKKEKIKEA